MFIPALYKYGVHRYIGWLLVLLLGFIALTIVRVVLTTRRRFGFIYSADNLKGNIENAYQVFRARWTSWSLVIWRHEVFAKEWEAVLRSWIEVGAIVICRWCRHHWFKKGFQPRWVRQRRVIGRQRHAAWVRLSSIIVVVLVGHLASFFRVVNAYAVLSGSSVEYEKLWAWSELSDLFFDHSTESETVQDVLFRGDPRKSDGSLAFYSRQRAAGITLITDLQPHCKYRIFQWPVLWVEPQYISRRRKKE